MSSSRLFKLSQETTGVQSPQGRQKAKTRKVFPILNTKDKVLQFCATLDFSDIDAINHAIRGMGNNFPYIGIGSGRLVYEFDENSVIKFAMNKNGAVQNTKESRVAARSDLMAKVLDICPNGNYVISERITPFSSNEEFESATGLSEKLLDALRDRGLKGESQFFRLTGKDLQLFQNTQFMSKLGLVPISSDSANLLGEMMQVARSNNLATADLFKPDSWGTDSSGNLKCLDYGFGIGSADLGMNARVYFEAGKPDSTTTPEPFVEQPYTEKVDETREGLFKHLPKYEALFNMCVMFQKHAKC